MGAITHQGEVLQRLPANASQINFNKTGTNLNSTQTENAIKEVNGKVNTNTEDITQLKSGLANLTRFVNLQSGQSITVDGSELLVVAKRQHEQTAYDVNAIMYLSGGSIYAVLNNGGNTTPITVSYDTTNVTTTITNNNGVAIILVIITN